MNKARKERSYKREDSIVFCKTDEEFGFLSNMAARFPLRVNGIDIRTSEALYQACRFPHLPDVQRLIIDQKSPMAAKMKSKSNRSQTRMDWNKVRVRIMRWCLRTKLACNWDQFRSKLLSTDDQPIVELSKKDSFWGAKERGDGSLVGTNALGRLLMELRQELRGDSTEALRVVKSPDVDDFLLYGEEIHFDRIATYSDKVAEDVSGDFSLNLVEDSIEYDTGDQSLGGRAVSVEANETVVSTDCGDSGKSPAKKYPKAP